METDVHNNFTKREKPRLKPIENPSSLKMKAAYWLTRRKIGKVITPLKVHYTRFPEALGLGWSLINIEDKFTINNTLRHLIQLYTATVNGCAFCIDMAKASLEKEGEQTEKINELLQFDTSTNFTESEKSALAYVDEVTRNKHVDDETFERLQEHFSEREIVQITLINAIENFYNTMNAPLNIGSDELCQLWD